MEVGNNTTRSLWINNYKSSSTMQLRSDHESSVISDEFLSIISRVLLVISTVNRQSYLIQTIEHGLMDSFIAQIKPDLYHTLSPNRPSTLQESHAVRTGDSLRRYSRTHLSHQHSQIDSDDIPSYVNTHEGSYFSCVTMSKRRGWYYKVNVIN